MASNADRIRALKAKQSQWMLERAQTIERSQPRPTAGGPSPSQASQQHASSPYSAANGAHAQRRLPARSNEAPSPKGSTSAAHGKAQPSPKQASTRQAPSPALLPARREPASHSPVASAAQAPTNGRTLPTAASNGAYGASEGWGGYFHGRADAAHPAGESVDDIAGRIADRLKLGIRDVLARESHAAAAARTEELAAKVESYIASETALYSCPVCQSLMAGPSRTPIVLIPCGHTFCEACLSARPPHAPCPLCKAAVQTRGRNAALLQTIEAFVARRRQIESEMAPAADAAHALRYSRIVGGEGLTGGGGVAGGAAGGHHYDAEAYGAQNGYGSHAYSGGVGAGPSAASVRAHEQAVRYQSEYRSFAMRCRILQNEFCDGRNALVAIDSKCAELGRAEQALEGEEESVARQIAALEAQRADIRARRDQKRREIDGLKSEKEQLRQRLGVVRETLVPLRTQRDKARLILANFDASAADDRDSESDCDLTD